MTLRGKKRPRTLQLIPWFGFSNYAYFDALHPEERKSEISLCQGQLKKPVSSITSYSWLFLRKIWPRTWQILILIRAGSELTTLAASIDRSLGVLPLQSAASPVSSACYLSAYRTATQGKAEGEVKANAAVVKKGMPQLCSPSSVPTPGPSRTVSHWNAPQRTQHPHYSIGQKMRGLRDAAREAAWPRPGLRISIHTASSLINAMMHIQFQSVLKSNQLMEK